MKSIKYILLIGLALNLSCDNDNDNDNEYSEPIHPKASNFQDVLDEFTSSGIPGLSAVVVTPDGIWKGASGYTRIEDNTPMSIDNEVYSASIGKTFCAVATLLLVQDGLIALDDPISNHIPSTTLLGFEHTDSITVRQLLNHTGGLTNFDWNEAFVSDVLNDPLSIKSSDLLDYERGNAFYAPPGTDFHYSSTGYELLAALIEEVTGNHARFYSERIFKPLNLQHTFYKNESEYPLTDNLVNSYFDQFDTKQVENVSETQNHLTHIFTGSDGIISTPLDYYKFLKEIMTGSILSDEIRSEMLDFISLGGDDYIGYGLGVWQRDVGYGIAIGHDGDAIGAGADMWYFPDHDIYIITATNVGTVLQDTELGRMYNESFLIALVTAVFE
ncbi:serine hydrolase domain-containing protein [Ulvibacterium marinum]|uniref:serine hydrolase domain-containing protein n=1 Tax=Ulvibacterium marinum TaxID=2419782 RepID=UPI002494B866|nr:serine hydrolase domain-containing protein [Ulvibacterium marinum]